MYGLTPHQRRLLTYLATLNHQGDLCPTLREIADFLGCRSKSSAHRLLDQLGERGYIRRLPNRERAIEVLPAGFRFAVEVEIGDVRFRFIPTCALVTTGDGR